jgi:hypothetical protein
MHVAEMLQRCAKSNNLSMQKTCFVIMHISDGDPYDIGHFKRVYEYIIKPACFEAEFPPVRGDVLYGIVILILTNR